MEKKIVISIDETGNIEAETFGIEGTQCVEELDKLMKDLARESSSIKKDEYYKNGICAENNIYITR